MTEGGGYWIPDTETKANRDSLSTFEMVSFLGWAIVGTVQKTIFLPWLV